LLATGRGYREQLGIQGRCARAACRKFSSTLDFKSAAGLFQDFPRMKEHGVLFGLNKTLERNIL
jgi:hypothetical protein